jgi:hypothetical protein
VNVKRGNYVRMMIVPGIVVSLSQDGISAPIVNGSSGLKLQTATMKTIIPITKEMDGAISLLQGQSSFQQHMIVGLPGVLLLPEKKGPLPGCNMPFGLGRLAGSQSGAKSRAMMA